MRATRYLSLALLVALIGLTDSAFAQTSPFGGTGGGAPQQGAGPQRDPVDENQKIREKAGSDDEGRYVGKRRPTTPKELYEEAERLLDRGYYTKAQEYLERVRIRFPFSQYATLADLKIGEVYLKKGEYAMAVESYRQFRKLHPNHPETHYVIYMMAKAEFEQAPAWSARDQSATRRALEIIDGARPPAVRPGFQFEERYPESIHIEEVKELRAEARERLAWKLFHIGRFYHKKSRYAAGEDKESALKAAVRRYEDLQSDYPNTEALAKTRWMEIRCLLELGDVEAADKELAELEEHAPESRELQLAKAYMERHREDALAKAKRATPEPEEEETTLSQAGD